MENILATRREFLHAAAAGTAGGLIAARTGNLESVLNAEQTQVPSKRITFEEARADKENGN